MSTLQIPEEAMPVVEILRRDVERPTARLVLNRDGAVRFECGKCPLGMHPAAKISTPIKGYFDKRYRISRMVLFPFWTWWDRLTLVQARRAIDLIWPKEQQ